MFGWLAKALAFCYQIWPSYAGAIILLTLAIMIVLLPLTLKGTRSMLEMQRLQPEMKRLQNKFKDDRQKLNEEMLALYKEHKVNPIGGCLPMILQIPVFWVLYRVLEGLTHRTPTGLDVGAALTGNVHAISAAGHFQPSYISNTSKLYEALHSTGRMMSLGIDLSESVLTAFKKGLGHSAPFLVLMVLVIATTYIQQWQMQSRTPKDAVNPQQQMMMKVMPLVFAVIYFAIPAGVVVYFLASNVFRIGQQYFITRTMYPAAAGAGASGGGGAATATAGGRGWRALLPSSDALPQVGRAQKGNQKGQGGQKSSQKRGAGKPVSRNKTGTKPSARAGGTQTSRAAQTSKGAPANKGGRNNQRTKARAAPKPQTSQPAQPAADRTTSGNGSTPTVGANGTSRGRSSAPNRKGPPPPRRAPSKKKRK